MSQQMTGSRRRSRSTVFILAAGATGLLLLGAHVCSLEPGAEMMLAEARDDVADLAQEVVTSSRRNAIVRAAERVGPAVVSISVIQTRIVSAHPFSSPFYDEFFGLFRDLFPERKYRREIPSMGSGFIIDSSGRILTNDHVVRGASEVGVTLTDGREFEGHVLGTDPEYDLALLEIDGDNLPHVELGDSDDLIIGEWAIAIGNPFGYLLKDAEPSVTVGVISALHRDVVGQTGQASVYKDMIQTDASINPGNSGGPLVNALGEVMGINSFIFSSTGGSHGIGFAIPINTAKRIIPELARYGRVRDVWVGLQAQEITPVLARSLGLTMSTGLIVTNVERGSPAHDSGIQRGDVIASINNEEVADYQSAERAFYGFRVGDTIDMKVLRGNHEIDTSLQLKERRRQ